ncbi:hypothetical protein DUNSADRAFT_11451 [Dunaliella salina]|uniref:C2H2-type domain-containing protein n=1 Tax=Dunaliella salina TaxID=3046 RepID=A0ABQ7GDB8_DUNSA|nr:hypothetical protein DUNSADRAFT_11451 [Dunaliella salina]|eukprot:KAF5832609.1 hypothetical protein DUNSADRAFT_11451 [Dunaliella salina]
MDPEARAGVDQNTKYHQVKKLAKSLQHHLSAQKREIEGLRYDLACRDQRIHELEEELQKRGQERPQSAPHQPIGMPPSAFAYCPPQGVAPPSSIASSPSHTSLHAPSFPLAAPSSATSNTTGQPSGVLESGSTAPPYTPSKDTVRDLSMSSCRHPSILQPPSPTTTTSAATTAATTPTRSTPPAPSLPHSATKVGNRLRSLFGFKGEQGSSKKKAAVESNPPSNTTIQRVPSATQGAYARVGSGRGVAGNAAGGLEGLGPLQQNLTRLRTEQHQMQQLAPGEQPAAAPALKGLTACPAFEAQPCGGVASGQLLPPQRSGLHAPPAPIRSHQPLAATLQQQQQQQQQPGAPAGPNVHADRCNSVEQDAVPTLQPKGIPTGLPRHSVDASRAPAPEQCAPRAAAGGEAVMEHTISTTNPEHAVSAEARGTCASHDSHDSGLSTRSAGLNSQGANPGAGSGEKGGKGRGRRTSSSWGSGSHDQPHLAAKPKLEGRGQGAADERNIDCAAAHAALNATRTAGCEAVGAHHRGGCTGRDDGQQQQQQQQQQAARPALAPLECPDAAGKDLPFESGLPKTPDQGKASGFGPHSSAVLAAKASKPPGCIPAPGGHLMAPAVVGHIRVQDTATEADTHVKHLQMAGKVPQGLYSNKANAQEAASNSDDEDEVTYEQTLRQSVADNFSRMHQTATHNAEDEGTVAQQAAPSVGTPTLPPKGATPNSVPTTSDRDGALKDTVNYECTIRESVAQQFERMRAQAPGMKHARDTVNFEGTIRESVAQQFERMQAQAAGPTAHLVSQQGPTSKQTRDTVNFESTIRESVVQQFERMQAQATNQVSQQGPTSKQTRDTVNFESTIRESVAQEFERMQAQAARGPAAQQASQQGTPSKQARDTVNFESTIRESVAQQFERMQAQVQTQVSQQGPPSKQARDTVNFESTIRESVALQFERMQAQAAADAAAQLKAQQHGSCNKQDAPDTVNFDSTIRESVAQQFERMKGSIQGGGQAESAAALGRFGAEAQSVTDSSEHGGWEEDELEDDGESDAIEPGLSEEQDVLPQRMMSMLRPGPSKHPLPGNGSSGGGMGDGAVLPHSSAPSQRCQQQQQQQQCGAAAEAVFESPAVRGPHSSAPEVQSFGSQGSSGTKGAPSRSLEDAVNGMLAAPGSVAGDGDQGAVAGGEQPSIAAEVGKDEEELEEEEEEGNEEEEEDLGDGCQPDWSDTTSNGDDDDDDGAGGGGGGHHQGVRRWQGGSGWGGGHTAQQGGTQGKQGTGNEQGKWGGSSRGGGPGGRYRAATHADSGVKSGEENGGAARTDSNVRGGEATSIAGVMQHLNASSHMPSGISAASGGVRCSTCNDGAAEGGGHDWQQHQQQQGSRERLAHYLRTVSSLNSSCDINCMMRSMAVFNKENSGMAGKGGGTASGMSTGAGAAVAQATWSSGDGGAASAGTTPHSLSPVFGGGSEGSRGKAVGAGEGAVLADGQSPCGRAAADVLRRGRAMPQSIAAAAAAEQDKVSPRDSKSSIPARVAAMAVLAHSLEGSKEPSTGSGRGPSRLSGLREGQAPLLADAPEGIGDTLRCEPARSEPEPPSRHSSPSHPVCQAALSSSSSSSSPPATAAGAAAATGPRNTETGTAASASEVPAVCTSDTALMQHTPSSAMAPKANSSAYHVRTSSLPCPVSAAAPLLNQLNSSKSTTLPGSPLGPATPEARTGACHIPCANNSDDNKRSSNSCCQVLQRSLSASPSCIRVPSCSCCDDDVAAPAASNASVPAEGSGSVHAKDKGSVLAEGSGAVPEMGNAAVPAMGNATVPEGSNAAVAAEGNAAVLPTASNASVPAAANASVSAAGDMAMPAVGNTAVLPAEGNATVPEESNAAVAAEGNAAVLPEAGNASVPAEIHASVPAAGDVAMPAVGNTAVLSAEGNATVPEGSNAAVAAEGNAAVLPAAGNASVPAAANASVPAADDVAMPAMGNTAVLSAEGNAAVPEKSNAAVPMAGNASVPAAAHASVPAEIHASAPATANVAVPGICAHSSVGPAVWLEERGGRSMTEAASSPPAAARTRDEQEGCMEEGCGSSYPSPLNNSSHHRLQHQQEQERMEAVGGTEAEPASAVLQHCGGVLPSPGSNPVAVCAIHTDAPASGSATKQPPQGDMELGATDQPQEAKSEPGATELPLQAKMELGGTDQLLQSKLEQGATEQPPQAMMEQGGTDQLLQSRTRQAARCSRDGRESCRCSGSSGTGDSKGSKAGCRHGGRGGAKGDGNRRSSTVKSSHSRSSTAKSSHSRSGTVEGSHSRSGAAKSSHSRSSTAKSSHSRSGTAEGSLSRRGKVRSSHSHHSTIESSPAAECSQRPSHHGQQQSVRCSASPASSRHNSSGSKRSRCVFAGSS